jgi:transcriptional regulator with XRE-family HTH domain
MARENVATKALGGELCAKARKLLGWSRRELAEAALVAERTIDALESGGSRPHPRAVENIRIALEAAGVQFRLDGVGLRQPRAKGSRHSAPAADGGQREVA